MCINVACVKKNKFNGHGQGSVCGMLKPKCVQKLRKFVDLVRGHNLRAGHLQIHHGQVIHRYFRSNDTVIRSP